MRIDRDLNLETQEHVTLNRQHTFDEEGDLIYLPFPPKYEVEVQ